PEARRTGAQGGSALRLHGPDGRGVPGAWFFSLKAGKYRLAVEYANSNPRQDNVPLWVGTARTEEVEFEITPPPNQGADAGRASVEKLIADLASDDGARRVEATNALFLRGPAVLGDLKKAGAKQVAPFGPVPPRRLDVVYSLLEGLPPTPPGARGGYRPGSFGIHVAKGVTKQQVIEMGRRYRFTLVNDYFC